MYNWGVLLLLAQWSLDRVIPEKGQKLVFQLNFNSLNRSLRVEKTIKIYIYISQAKGFIQRYVEYKQKAYEWKLEAWLAAFY